MTRTLENALLALQCFHVAFLFLHDWIPLSRLNDVAGVRRMNTGATIDARHGYWGHSLRSRASFQLVLLWWSEPCLVRYWLWVSYGVLFFGEFASMVDSLPVAA